MLRNVPWIKKKEHQTQETTEHQNISGVAGNLERISIRKTAEAHTTNHKEECLAPLNRAIVHILDEILQSGLAKRPPPTERHYIMGRNQDASCHYH
jgi:hypothetical protein